MMCIKSVCYLVRWLFACVEDRQKIYDMTRQIQTKNIGSRGRGLILLLIPLFSPSIHYLLSHVTRHRTTILHGLNKQHSKPSNTSTSPCSTLSPLFFMFLFLRQVQQPSRSSQPKLRRLRLPPSSSMQNSHQLQHRHRGSMLKELLLFHTHTHDVR
jgi:hypothetical protein